MKICSVEEMREMDRRAVEHYGIIEALLMENAALATCSVILREFGLAGKRFSVVCGMGNNGGDGLAIARKLHSNGGIVSVYLLGDPARLSGAAKLNYEIASRMPFTMESIQSAESVRLKLLHADVIVDAVFGTGLARNVEGMYRDVIDCINAAGKLVFSVDIPSGINGDTGQIMGAAVNANITTTYGLPKRGTILYPGHERCGSLYVSHISFPPELYESENVKVAFNDPLPLPSRDRQGHKGDFGEALFIAGAANYCGAPYFSAMSFLKAGGGYCRLAAPLSISPFIAVEGSEIVFIPQTETETGSISRTNRKELLDLTERMDMVVIGPGLSLHDETQQLVRELTREIEKPLLIDGDGITAVCDNLGAVKSRRAPTILTPHPGEMSRLSKQTVTALKSDPITIIQNTAKNLNAIIVLKGAHSLVGCPDGRVYINMSGNPGMATAGSGDVLTGTIAAMFGLGQPVEAAVRTGVFVHGISGDLAAESIGEDGVTATDILAHLPRAVKIVRQGGDTMRRFLHTPPVL
ncbi:MAG TPA: NAD(P)H-hydrate dehydratase [Deltaproteobacteria bacterium]|nr:NAD(P)H-hydrate dehydratase [Deltaproteobacteria bacterium]